MNSPTLFQAKRFFVANLFRHASEEFFLCRTRGNTFSTRSVAGKVTVGNFEPIHLIHLAFAE